MLGAIVHSGLGLAEAPVRGRFLVRGGTYARGHVLCMDYARSYATNALVGDPGSVFSIIRAVDAGAQLGVGTVVVITDEAPGSFADGSKAQGTAAGFCEAYIRKASGDVSPGDPLCVKNGQTYLSADFAPGDRIVATYQPIDGSVLSGPSTATIGRVLLEGRYGLGVDV